MTPRAIYEERLSSGRTEALFVVLALLFLMLAAWRALEAGLSGWNVVLLALFAFCLSYSLNYRTLVIRLNAETLALKFGWIRWAIPLKNIEACFSDETSLWRIGGAGIHFTLLRATYRAMLNFLEHLRLVVALRLKQGARAGHCVLNTAPYGAGEPHPGRRIEEPRCLISPCCKPREEQR